MEPNVNIVQNEKLTILYHSYVYHKYTHIIPIYTMNI
jgi:hypothetical protein